MAKSGLDQITIAIVGAIIFLILILVLYTACDSMEKNYPTTKLLVGGICNPAIESINLLSHFDDIKTQLIIGFVALAAIYWWWQGRERE